MEVAIDVWARGLGVDTDAVRCVPVVRRVPFDPHRRSMTVVRGGWAYTKGAPDAVLHGLGEQPDAAAALRAVDDMAARGLRTLAVVRTPDPSPGTSTSVEVLGVLGLEDPPRDGVAEALAACRIAGVRVAMLTGDHPATARAIADAIGLRAVHDPVLVGTQLPQDPTALGDLLDAGGVVIARVSPEDKLRIAEALQARGHVVAMTGDGVNDVPALHAADIGVAMGRSGTDVARESADLVLLDDHFASIVAGIEQGRATFANIRRFLTYHLTDNVAEVAPFIVWAASGGNIPLALGVLQILALDIATDTLSAVALGAEPARPHVLLDPPTRGHLLRRGVLVRAFGVLGPLEAALSMSAFFAVLAFRGWPDLGDDTLARVVAEASGAAFVTVVLAQGANAFACRSGRWPPWRIGWSTNRLLPPAVAVGTTLGLATLVIPPVAVAFGQAVPSWPGWLVACSAPVILLGTDAVVKWSRRRLMRMPGPAEPA
jgi:magnesium-transporting ATPase (P-type)